MQAHRLATASTLIACALSANVHAEAMSASASASITHLTFTLIDLAPLDGIAPSLQFLDSSGALGSWEASVHTNTITPDGFSNDMGSVQVLPSGTLSPLTPNELSVANTAGQASMVLTASSIHLQASTTMDAATAATGISRYVNAYIAPSMNGWGNVIRYTLSANTAVRVQGQYQLSAQSQVDEALGSGYAYAGLDFVGVSSAAESTVSQQVYTSTLGFPGLSSGSFDFFLGNKSSLSEENMLFVTLSASASLNGLVSDVPEPTSVALMLAGLGVACAAGQRRRAGR
jgi:hypothetical protein